VLSGHKLAFSFPLLITSHRPPATGHRSLTDFYCINYADYRGVNWTLFAAEGHPRGASLNDQDDFVNARADGIYGNDVTLLILAVNTHQPRDQQLASVKTIVFPRSDDSSNYSSKNHIRLEGTGYR